MVIDLFFSSVLFLLYSSQIETNQKLGPSPLDDAVSLQEQTSLEDGFPDRNNSRPMASGFDVRPESS